MGIRVINLHGQPSEVLPFAKQKDPGIWCWFNVHTLEHNLVYGKKPVTKKTNKTGANFMVEFSTGTFKTLAAGSSNTLRDFVKKIKKIKVHTLSRQNLIMDAAMQKCISAITQYRGNEETKNIFMNFKVMELLWLQQENYLRSKQPRLVYVKSEYDKERIVFARDYLLTHLDAPPSLLQLAAIAGINEFKLKRGFKEMFNQTVFAYLADVRLDMARRALREKQKNLTQIAFELGYSSLQHFSKAFKEKFGASPVKFRD